MRNKFADVFYELGKEDDDLCIVVADISPAGSIGKFREEFPDRFVNTGVAEQVMIGMVAGMAQRGLKPFAYTIATFSLYRPFEFIRDDICYQNLPITIVGIGAGVVYSTLGGTHHAMEDISIASAIPNMSIISPSDPLEVEAATRWCAKQDIGPVYLRLGKAGEPDLTTNAIEAWEFGKLRCLEKSGSDVAIITYGAIAKKSFEVAQGLRETGREVSLFSCHTIKPLDEEGIRSVLSHYKEVIIIEETTPSASLGTQVKRIAWDCSANCKIQAFSLQDAFLHCYGSHDDLLNAHGLSFEKIMYQLKQG